MEKKTERKFKVTPSGSTSAGVAAIGKLLPMSPKDGPPLPRGLGITWAGKGAKEDSLEKQLADAIPDETKDAAKYSKMAQAAVREGKKALARMLTEIAADEEKHATWLKKAVKE